MHVVKKISKLYNKTSKCPSFPDFISWKLAEVSANDILLL